jgi:hypothetical protein
MSATGAIVSIIEPRCSEQAKSRAGKAALQLIEKIGKLTGAVLVAAEETESDGDKPGDKKQPEAFIFNFPNIKGSQSDLPDMIAMNLDKGKVN